MAQPPESSPWKVATSPSSPTRLIPASVKKSFIAKHVIWIAGAGFLIFIALGICIFMLCCYKSKPKKNDVEGFAEALNKPICNDTVFEATNQGGKGKFNSS